MVLVDADEKADHHDDPASTVVEPLTSCSLARLGARLSNSAWCTNDCLMLPTVLTIFWGSDISARSTTGVSNLVMLKNG